MFYYFANEESKKPFSKAVIRACEYHARKLADERIVSRIQILH